MNPEQERKLDRVIAGVARLEGRFDEVQKATDRALSDLHGRVRDVDTRATDRMNRMDSEVSAVRNDVYRPALLSGGGAGGMIAIAWAAIQHFFIGGNNS